MLIACYFERGNAGNQCRVLLAMRTKKSMTGTSTKTPTTVARVAPESKPKREIATATANSKKFEAPIIPAGAATSCGKCHEPLISGHPVNVTDQNFSRFLEKNDLPLIVDFWANWCGPCKNFAPVFSQVASEMSTQITFAKLDTESQQYTASRYQIRSIPTLMLFHHGREIARLSGALPKPQFTQWLKQQLASIQ